MKPTHIKRPPNSFMVWARENRSTIQSQNRDLSNADISKLLGIEWYKLSTLTKLKYKQIADDLKIKHLKDNPNYKYRPNLKKHQNIKDIAIKDKSIKKNHIVKNKLIKNNRFKKIKTITTKHKKYMSLNININEDTLSNDDITTQPNQLPSCNMSLNINMNYNWLYYNDTHDYYKDIQLFYQNL